MALLPPAIKLLAIDIDGTLLNPQKQITPRTQKAIHLARAAGIVVTLATARRYRNTAPIATALEMEIPLVLCDGALAMHHPDASVLFTQLLDTYVAQQAVDIMVQHGIQPVIQLVNGATEETWTGYSAFDNEWVATYFSLYPEHTRRLAYAQCCIGQPEPLRVVAFASDEVVTALIPQVAALPCAWNYTQRGSYGTAELTVMNPVCSKASGVALLAQHLGIAMEEVMAIGDNNNDLAMLQAVGWSVAMGQAPETIKAVANAVTTSNAEDGVALAIERYALGLDWDANAASNSRNRLTCL
jgi:Cof subfamily protein (haloacid dehalogenase superfamily)